MGIATGLPQSTYVDQNFPKPQYELSGLEHDYGPTYPPVFKDIPDVPDVPFRPSAPSLLNRKGFSIGAQARDNIGLGIALANAGADTGNMKSANAGFVALAKTDNNSLTGKRGKVRRKPINLLEALIEPFAPIAHATQPWVEKPQFSNAGLSNAPINLFEGFANPFATPVVASAYAEQSEEQPNAAGANEAAVEQPQPTAPQEAAQTQVEDQQAGPPPPPVAQPEEQQATLSLPLVIDGRRYQPVTATITQSRAVAVSSIDLARATSDLLTDQTSTAILALGDGLVPVESYAPLGISVSLNPATLAIEVGVDPSLLRGRTVAASRDIDFTGVERITPSDFSFGVTAAAIASSSLDSNFEPNTQIDFAGFLNIGGIRGLNIDYGGNFQVANGGGRRTFIRDRIVGFTDWPDQAFRLSAGDVIPNQSRLAGAFDVFGLNFERNYEAIQPTRNIRPNAARSLRLERRSAVEVYVNNVLVERFIADPGPIDITRIPLAAFSNNVSIVVEDSLGRREVESFAFGSDINLLAEGLDQFSFSAGFLRNPLNIGFSYTDDPVVSAFYQRGISSTLTIAGHAVATEATQSVGAGAAIGVGVGTITMDAALSEDEILGTGVAAGATFRGSPFFGVDQGEFATLTFDYRSREFTSLDQFGFLQNIKFDLRAEYQIDVGERTALFGSANYVERYDIQDPDVFLSAGFRQNFNSFFLTLAARYAERANADTDVGVLATLTIPFGTRNSFTATYDTASNRGRAEFRRLRGLTLPEVDYRIGVSRSPNDNSLFGSLGFANTRFDTEADVTQRFGRDGSSDDRFGTARFQTGIGYADGEFAIGRDPGRGFAIVSRHESIEDSQIAVRTSAAGRELAFANDFGSAIATINSPYRPQEVTVDAQNLPIGYDIGAGRYLLESGARSGLLIEVGSDAFRTAIATLFVDDAPVALEYGRYTKVGDEDAPPSTFFTNRAGRAAFSNLSPGDYVIEIPGIRARGTFTISEESEALVRLEDLELERQ
ncbi:MAG: fimbria/pilus outer membrane usher protein [Pseudomonadota bacterium]